jgi:hypothetical protein
MPNTKQIREKKKEDKGKRKTGIQYQSSFLRQHHTLALSYLFYLSLTRHLAGYGVRLKGEVVPVFN